MKKTILFGNGFNQLSENPINWTSLLEKLKKKAFLNNSLPNTMIYERILMERNGSDKRTYSLEKEIKDEIANQMLQLESNEHYQMLFDLGCHNYLTTNYDYAFKNGIINTGYSSHNNSTEGIYSIRRNTSIFNSENKEVCKIWNIHGEINRPKTIMLGLDHYCGSVGKLDGYIKGKYEFQENSKSLRVRSIVQKLKDKKYDEYSWVELFFNSDIHIIGLGLDYSETDLWWILNKRARIMTDEKKSIRMLNKIYFYTDMSISSEKEGLLKSFNVIVIKDEVINNDWKSHYYRNLDKIKK